MRLQHLALFRGIGLGACAVNLGSRMPSACLAPDRLWRLPSDNHRVTVEVAPDSPLRFPNVALRQNHFSSFCELARVREAMMAINEAAQRPLS
jgi:hypothetical protein